MLIAFILFAVIIIISFILAVLSMKNYQDLPNVNKIPYSLYLIKKEEAVTKSLLEELYKTISPGGLIVSFERLFKGSRKALVIFGPSKILSKFINVLDLVELEDYTKESDEGLFCSEISSKKFTPAENGLSLKNAVLSLENKEQLWWQVVLQPSTEGNGHLVITQTSCRAIVRLCVKANENIKAKNLQEEVSRIIRDKNLIILPQAYSSSQILGFYKQRSLPQSMLKGEEGAFKIDFPDLLKIIP